MGYRKNANRGYRALRVWQDAKQLYILTWKIFGKFPYELKRVASQQIGSVDSVQRNIAEGYCRRTGTKEYLLFLNYAKASLGESVSSVEVYYETGHISKEEYEDWDSLAFKLENGLLRLIDSLEKKRDGDNNNIVQEPTITYEQNSLIPKIENHHPFEPNPHPPNPEG